MPPDIDRGCMTCVPSVVVVRIARPVVEQARKQASAYAIVIREWGLRSVREDPRLSHWVSKYRRITTISPAVPADFKGGSQLLCTVVPRSASFQVSLCTRHCPVQLKAPSGLIRISILGTYSLKTKIQLVKDWPAVCCSSSKNGR